MPNASNTNRITEVLSLAAQRSEVAAVDAVDVTSQRAVIAVQGPHAREHLERVVPGSGSVGRFRVAQVDWRGEALIVAGTGYTGEDGLELAVPVDRCVELWNALAESGVTPAGLGARDTLRLEAGLPLHGHELGTGITSLQADLDWVVAWNKPEFQGRDALSVERDSGVHRILRGLALDGRRPAREGSEVLRHGERIGVVTSGNFSPELGHAIALALLDPDTVVGEQVVVDVRGTLIDARIVDLPFV
jgi:aminomethyltransferase